MRNGSFKFAGLATLIVAGMALEAVGAPFTPGTVSVYRIGTGTGSLLNTGAAVFIDEYSLAGTLIQSVALPTTVSGANKQLIASGTASSEGLLSASADGQYLVLTGYARDLGGVGSLAGTTSATVPRTVGLVDYNAAINTSTALTDFASANNPRSATSVDGTGVWVGGGAGGVRYATIGSSTSNDLTSSTLANVRQLNIFNSQLYASSNNGTNTFKGIETIGSVGPPTSGSQTVTRLPGLTDTNSPSTFDFFFADLSAGVAGIDTLYVADDDVAALSKFSLVSGSWVLNGTVGANADDYRGLAGIVSGTTVTLVATRKGGGGATGGGELVSLVDSSGYNGAFTGTPTLLATAVTNTAFRGVALSPVQAVPEPTALVLAAMGMLGLCGARRRRMV